MGKESFSLLFGHKLELRLERIQNKMTTPGTDGERYAELNFGHTGFSVTRRKSAIAAFGRSIFHSNLRFNYKKREKTKTAPPGREKQTSQKKAKNTARGEKEKTARQFCRRGKKKSCGIKKHVFRRYQKRRHQTGVPAKSMFCGA